MRLLRPGAAGEERRAGLEEDRLLAGGEAEQHALALGGQRGLAEDVGEVPGDVAVREPVDPGLDVLEELELGQDEAERGVDLAGAEARLEAALDRRAEGGDDVEELLVGVDERLPGGAGAVDGVGGGRRRR